MVQSGTPELDLFVVIISFVVTFGVACALIVIFWRIFSKTGNSGALSLLMFVPFINIAMMLYLAFAEWPIEREVQSLRSQQADDILH